MGAWIIVSAAANLLAGNLTTMLFTAITPAVAATVLGA